MEENLLGSKEKNGCWEWGGGGEQKNCANFPTTVLLATEEF